MSTIIFVVLTAIVIISGYLMGTSSKYKSSVLVSKFDMKFSKYSSFSAVMFSFGIILIISIPALYLFKHGNLAPLALILGPFCLAFAFIFRKK